MLPTLNNLLENREMALDDGRFLLSAARYDALANVLFTMYTLYNPILYNPHPKS